MHIMVKAHMEKERICDRQEAIEVIIFCFRIGSPLGMVSTRSAAGVIRASALYLILCVKKVKMARKEKGRT